MDFFSAQDAARRRTRQLLILFCCAVAALLVLANLAIALGMWMFDEGLFGTWTFVVTAPELDLARPPPASLAAYLRGPVFPVVSVLVLAAVGLAMLWKRRQLGRGGSVVAKMLGGELLPPDCREPGLRRLLNVVEEMAIASGTPVPPVYLLQEPAINAFAAGYSADDAVIGITRGAVEHLSRDELQGVIGHEFSHILNGDMRLNMRLISTLHGILFLALAGRLLMQGSRRRSIPRAGGRGGSLPIALLGFLLLAIGSGGVLFGRVIKAAVSRQREYLADASSVQFTRNPSGLAGALKKTGALAERGRLQAPRAEEASHLFFADALGGGFARFLATHPPLDERIRRLVPDWDGRFAVPGGGPGAEDGAPAASLSGGLPATAAVAPVARAAAERDGLPERLRAACRSPASAATVVLACLSHTEDGQELALRAAPEAAVELRALRAVIGELGEAAVLQVLELAMPALAQLTQNEVSSLRQWIAALSALDRRMDLVETIIAALLERHVGAGRAMIRDSLPRYRNLQQIHAPLTVLLSALAWTGGAQRPAAEAALRRAETELGIGELRLLSAETVRWDATRGSLGRIRGAFPLLKPRVLKACREALRVDGELPQGGMYLLRLIAAAIDCPLPPYQVAQSLDGRGRAA